MWGDWGLLIFGTLGSRAKCQIIMPHFIAAKVSMIAVTAQVLKSSSSLDSD